MVLGHGEPGQRVSRGGTCLCPHCVLGKTSRGRVERSRLEVGGWCRGKLEGHPGDT